MNPQKRLKIKDILEHPFIKKHSKKKYDKIHNQLSKKINDINNNISISGKKPENNIDNKISKRSNTLGINSMTEPKFGMNFISSKELLFKDININNNINNKEIENSKKDNNKHKSSKQLKILAKFRYSFNAQLEKAKKSIENLNFKNSKNVTFEDIRDSQLLSEKNENFKRYKKYKSSKYNNYYDFNNLKTEESKSKNLYEIKNSLSDKNIIYENNLEDFVDGPDEIEALKRLNKAYDKYEKQNLGIINE